MAIKVETTTDSVDDVKRSVGEEVVIEEEAKDDDKTQKDSDGKESKAPKKAAAKAAGSSKAGDSDDDADPDEEEEETEEEAKGDEEPKGGKKKAADAADKETPEGEEEPRPKKKNSNRRKIERLRELLEEERGKRVAAEARAAAPKGDKDGADTKDDKKTPKLYSGKPRPTRDQFADSDDPDGDFAEAVGRWGASEEIAKAEFERQSKDGQDNSKKVLKAYTTRVAEAKRLIPDFDQAFDDLEEDLQVTPTMQYLMFTSEIGPFIARWLALHPDKAEEVAGLEGAEQIREMGKIEAKVQDQVDKLKKKAKTKSKDANADDDPDEDDDADADDDEEKPDTSKKTAPPKKISTAPKPISKAKGTGREGPKTLADLAGNEDRLVDHAKFSPEYAKMRKEQRRGRS